MPKIEFEEITNGCKADPIPVYKSETIFELVDSLIKSTAKRLENMVRPCEYCGCSNTNDGYGYCTRCGAPMS